MTLERALATHHWFFAPPLALIAGQYARLDGILAVLGAALLLNWDTIIPG